MLRQQWRVLLRGLGRPALLQAALPRAGLALSGSWHRHVVVLGREVHTGSRHPPWWPPVMIQLLMTQAVMTQSVMTQSVVTRAVMTQALMTQVVMTQVAMAQTPLHL